VTPERPPAPLTTPDPLSRLTEATDLAYWRGLDEQLHITNVGAATPPPVDDAPDDLTERLAREGLARVPAAVDSEAVARARRAIDVVTAAGWPRVFAWLFDEVWVCARAPGVRAALASVLGEGYRQLPGVWVHQVEAEPGARGWGPHTDNHGRARSKGGAPARLTGWLALTDATIDNGCIYYVPNHVTADLADRFESMERVQTGEGMRWLQHARAAEAAAGTLLLWRTDVFHWGSVATADAAGPRIAISIEAAHEDAPPRATEQPAFDPATLPSFAERLSVIGRGLLAYGKAKEREPFAHTFVPLGAELCDLWLA